jgi:hypothetical protein
VTWNPPLGNRARRRPNLETFVNLWNKKRSKRDQKKHPQAMYRLLQIFPKFIADHR